MTEILQKTKSLLSFHKKFFAFTLAEVLITLGIIGVVAAITLPTLMRNITVRLQSEREANIVQKITKSMEMMKVDGKLNTTYESTDAFVDEFQKYIKIAQRCDSSNLDKCWGVTSVINSDGDKYEVNDAQTGESINIMTNKTNNVGLVLADGTPIILTYNENASPISDTEQSVSSFKELPVGFGRTKRFAYTTGVTAPIAFVMDTNGGKGPNKEKIDDKYYDIRGFNGASFSKSCGSDIFFAGKCWRPVKEETNNSTYVNNPSPYCNSIGGRAPTQDEFIAICLKDKQAETRKLADWKFVHCAYENGTRAMVNTITCTKANTGQWWGTYCIMK